jgi:hypothetical protein
MPPQTFELSAQYRFAVLRVIALGFSTLLAMSLVMIPLMSILPTSWMPVVFILLTIASIWFLQQYVPMVGHYDLLVEVDENGLKLSSFSDEIPETLVPWSELKDYRMITQPPHVGFSGSLYLRRHNKPALQLHGLEMKAFYTYLVTHFPKKEWRFLGAPK